MLALVKRTVLLSVRWTAVLLVLTVSQGIAARMYGQVCGFGLAEASRISGWVWLFAGHSGPWCPILLHTTASLGTVLAYAWQGAFAIVTLKICSQTLNSVNGLPKPPHA